jgi:hypothetical protein
MKKFIYILAFAGLVAVACSKEAPTTKEQTSEVGTYTFVLNASVAEELTKTTYDGDKTFSWSKGDQISVLFHNASNDNKFFTLTTVNSGGSAKFTGEITNGYTIGASDTGIKWALYPASTHTYDLTTQFPVFNIPAVTDFSATHYSANLPMAAEGDDNGNFTFKHMTNAFKFTFTNLDVAKVQITIENTAGYDISGDNPVNKSGSDNYIAYNTWGSSTRVISFIADVPSSKTVSVYVPYRMWDSGFKPKFTITNYATNGVIKTGTATSTFSSTFGEALNTIGRVMILPAISAPGTGYVFTPAITIDGNMSDWAGATTLTSATTGRIREWKFKSDEQFVYVYVKLRAEKVATTKNLYVGFDTDNDSSTQISAYAGDMTGCEAVAKIVPVSADDPLTLVSGLDPNSRVYSSTGSSTSGTVKCAGYIESGEAYVEISIPRSELGIPAAGASISVGCSYEWNLTGNSSVTLE